MDAAALAIGLPGALPAPVIRALAARIQELGFRALWLNDTPDGDALARLAAAASVTSTLRLGVGVIPVDRRPASAIAAGLAGLPADRLTIGIGAGGPDRALERVAAAIAELRAATDAPIVVGGLGPRMRRLATERADGVLLNWLTPAAAEQAAREAGGARTILYVRTIVDAGALPALHAEAARYGGYGAYRANLERIGATAMDATIAGIDKPSLAAGLDEFEGTVDEIVLRAITAGGGRDELLRFVETVAAS